MAGNKFTITNKSDGVLLVYDSGQQRTIAKGQYNLELDSDEVGNPEAIKLIGANSPYLEILIRNPAVVRSITDEVAGTSPTVSSTLAGLYAQISGFFSLSNPIIASDISNIVEISQVAYDLLTPDADTLYLITS